MNEGKGYVFHLNEPIHYYWSGKFVGNDKNWKHMERVLKDFELIVMEKGTLYIEDEWERYEIHEGEYLLMEPTACQRGYQSSKCSFYWMHFSIDRFEEVSVDGKFPLTDLRREPPGNTEVVIERQGKLTSDQRIIILLKQLQDTELRYMDKDFCSFLSTGILYELSHQQRNPKNDEKEKNLVEQVSEYIVEHFHEELHVGQIAASFGYNEKYFSTAFRKKAGVGLKRFIDLKKMERAKYLLLNTNAWVVEIAETLGYQNVQNFYHIFRRETNCTPTEFRTIYGKKNEFDR